MPQLVAVNPNKTHLQTTGWPAGKVITAGTRFSVGKSNFTVALDATPNQQGAAVLYIRGSVKKVLKEGSAIEVLA